MRAAAALLAAGGLLLSGCGAGGVAPHAARRTPPRVSAAVTSTPPPTHIVVRRAPWRLPAPIAREAAVLLPDRTHALLAGGLLPGDASSTAAYRLDLTTGRADRRRALPIAVHDTAGVLLHGAPLVVGGGNAAEQAVVQSVPVHGLPHVAGRLPGARSDLVATSDGGRACVLGGYDGTTPALGEVLCSTDGRHWRRIASLPVPVRYAGLAVRGSTAWLIGGERSGAMVDVVQRIELSTGAARVVAHLPVPLGHTAAVVAGDRVLVAGGRTGVDTVTDRTWWFDPHTDRVTAGPRLPWPLADSAVVAAGGTSYLLGGETPTETDRVIEVRQQPVSGR